MEYSTVNRNIIEEKSKPMNYEISFHLSSDARGAIEKAAEKMMLEKGEVLSKAFLEFTQEVGVDASKNSLTSTISIMKFSERLYRYLDIEQLSHILLKQIIRRRGPLVTFYTDEATYHGLDRLFLMFGVPVNKDALVEIMLLVYAKRNGGETV